MQMKNQMMTSSEDEQRSKSASPLMKISNNTIILAPIQTNILTPKSTAPSLAENSKIIPRPRSGTAAVYYSVDGTAVHPRLTSQCSNRPSRSVKRMSECISPVTTNRPFKPQLDDLKSSNLLLDKSKQPDHNADNKGQNDYKMNKPPINVHLHQVKKRFQSKEYWHESKYDKIEGLNWISWG